MLHPGWGWVLMCLYPTLPTRPLTCALYFPASTSSYRLARRW